jgi:hypothetical protein
MVILEIFSNLFSYSPSEPANVSNDNAQRAVSSHNKQNKLNVVR